MKILLLAAVFITFLAFTDKNSAGHTTTSRLDTMPAEMKQYWLVLLLKGPNRTHDKVTASRIQSAHLANIDKLWKEGKVIMAGPMGYKYDADLRGIFIMDAKDSTTAASYVNTDSAVITGRLRFQLHPWWTQKGTYTFK